jgi:hypothetical protein
LIILDSPAVDGVVMSQRVIDARGDPAANDTKPRSGRAHDMRIVTA